MLCEVPVAPLDDRVMEEGPDNGRLEIIDYHFFRHAPKPLEGLPVAPKPGLDLLVEDEGGVLVAAVGEGHDEDPRFLQLSCLGVGHLAGRAEVDLGLLSRADLDADKSLGVGRLQMKDEAPERRVAARVAVVLLQTLAEGLHLHPLVAKLADDLLKAGRLERLTGESRLGQSLSETPVQILGRGEDAVEEALLPSQGSVLGHGLSGHPKVVGDGPVRLAGPEPADELANIERHKSPSCHAIPSLV